MPFRIINPDIHADTFLQEWTGGKPTITAFTSGSTGAPKQISLPRPDLIFSAQATLNFFKISQNSVMVCPLSASYIAGKMMIVRAILSDSTLIFLPPSNHPLDSLDPAILHGKPISLLPIVPSQLPGLIDWVSSHPDVKIQNVIIGGAPLSPQAERSLLSPLPFRPYATYGMTETCSHVALRPLSVPDAPFVAMPGVTFDIDPERGSLAISSTGYSFRRLVTNDAVTLISPTSFRWLGRIDNVINSGGVKLHPEIIERKISPAIPRPFYLTSEPSDKWGEQLLLVVEGTDTDLPAILDSCRALLPPSHCPKRAVALPSLPRTSSGKIIRRHLTD